MSSSVRTISYGLNGHVQITLEKKEKSEYTTLQNMNFVHLHPMIGGGSLDDKNVTQLISNIKSCHSTMQLLEGDILSDTLGKADLKQVQGNAGVFASQCVDEACCVRAFLINEIKVNPRKKELLPVIDEVTPLCAYRSTSDDIALRQVVKHAPVELSEVILKRNLLDAQEHVFINSSNIRICFKLEVSPTDIGLRITSGTTFRVSCVYCFENGIYHECSKSREDIHSSIVNDIMASLDIKDTVTTLPII